MNFGGKGSNGGPSFEFKFDDDFSESNFGFSGSSQVRA
jgi:hypothetical protein